MTDETPSIRKPEPVWLSTQQLAELTGIPSESWRTWRRRNIGPPYVQVGPRVVRYMRTDVEAWMVEHRKVG